MTWYAALFFNFVSALTAVLGFFVGVGIGTNSEEANSWILALAAGIFLYIALVDLVSSKDLKPSVVETILTFPPLN